MSGSTSLVSRFERQAGSTPAAIAIDDAGQRVTYQQLDAWSDEVCAELMAAGVVPGGLVGVLLPRDSRWIAAILGVLKTGCGYVPLDPMYPAERLAMMASDSALTLVLGESSGTEPVLGLPCVAMPAPTAQGRSTAHPPVGPDAPAYVIYTSGSTGRPKGVPIRHRNVLALLDAARARMPFAATDVWSLFHSFSFDFSVWEMWGPLLSGARIVLVPQNVRLDPQEFVSFLASSGVTVCNMVPSIFRHLVASGDGPQDELALRQVVFGGEAVDPVSVSEWLSALPADRRPAIANMYGITESTVHVTLRQMTAADFSRSAPGTLIGTPLSHVRMRLVDSQLRPVEPGDVGEILLDGAGISDGYLGRAELNRERFPTRIGDDGSSEHCFRTGDLASWDEATGSYVHRGRIDDQVQLRGHRIELGEVEASLRACPDVFDAAVVLHSPAGRDSSLLAHVVAAPSTAAAPHHTHEADDPEHAHRVVRAIRRSLADLLPHYMIPQHIRLVPTLPTSESGKVDRNALVPPSHSAEQ
ncbi:amino acid adenylation domain-containing protein [Actinoalloteichus fjordicus]|uniref:Amino acid adenylation enzyme/thioester reductase family protein n=1 Tax=Actinoalloteichus fjordicus TaxID=1612552 RepID=A0AAC9LA26_9PSEU|nr:amino acid adenylation domain-containing protein [Actinoalloteichus fjordicus]APU13110.1 amino acid adenylation enzyme/thioester reductase family protein [Actinoalloteichus fjordicus]